MPAPSDYEDIERLLDGRLTITDVRYLMDGEVESYKDMLQPVHLAKQRLEDLDPRIEAILAHKLHDKLAVLAQKEAEDPAKDYAFWNKGMTLLMYAAVHGAKFAIVPLLEYYNNLNFKMPSFRKESEDNFTDIENANAFIIAEKNENFVFWTALKFISEKIQNPLLTIDDYINTMAVPTTAILYKNYQEDIKLALEGLPIDLSAIKQSAMQTSKNTFEEYAYAHYTQVNDALLKNVLKELSKPATVSPKTGLELQKQIKDILAATSTSQLSLILTHLSDKEKPGQVTKDDFLFIVRLLGNEEQLKWFADVKIKESAAKTTATEVKQVSVVTDHAQTLAARGESFSEKKVHAGALYLHNTQQKNPESEPAPAIKVGKSRGRT